MEAWDVSPRCASPISIESAMRMAHGVPAHSAIRFADSLVGGPISWD